MTNALQISCVQMHWAKSIEFNLHRTLHYIAAAAEQGSQVVLFPEANLTSYYYPYLLELDLQHVDDALKRTCSAAAEHKIWVIVGSLRKTADRFLNLAHVINPQGDIVHEYAKVHMAGKDEKKYCRGGDKLSFFEIEGVMCSIVICRDGRHPELYRIATDCCHAGRLTPSCRDYDTRIIFIIPKMLIHRLYRIDLIWTKRHR